MERCQKLLLQDEQLQRVLPSREAMELMRQRCQSSIACLATACELYVDRPCFGYRAFEAARDLLQFRYLTYAELWARIQAFASGLRHGELAETGSLVGICGFGSPDWVVADLACLYLAAVSVPLQTKMSPADLQHIILEAEVRCIVCSLEELAAIEAVLPRCPSVRSLVVMDFATQRHAEVEDLARRKQALHSEHGGRLTLTTMLEVEHLGRERGAVPMVAPSESKAGERDPTRTLVYTSGSTGTPKGAMFPESTWLHQWRAPLLSKLPAVPHIALSFMPLSHAAGRADVIIHSIMRGGLTCFTRKSDMSSLFEDIRLARPTTLSLVPRVTSMIYQHYQVELVKRSRSRDRGDEPGAPEERQRRSARILEEMRASFLGDRLLYMTTSTAPTAPEVLSFLERAFEVPVVNIYGCTELGVMTVNERISREGVTAFKLVDAPELGYLRTDAPYPRGELCVKSRRQIAGYYRNPEATRELFDEEGYLKTGDIVEQRGPEQVVWIDRKKNILKLSQGEFVSVSRLEGLYGARSPFIHQIYLHGDSLRAYLLAVVVPDARAVDTYLRQRQTEPTPAAIKQLIRSELQRIATEEQAHGYEVPRDFLLEATPFTQDNGLLTESNKPSRPRLKARYGERLERLYVEIEQKQLAELDELKRSHGSQRSASEKVKKALEITLGLSELDVGQTQQSFLQLGGDSLSAVRLVSLLQDACGVTVPVGLVLDPTNRLQAIVQYVESSIVGMAPRHDVTFEQVHGAGAQVIRAEELRLDRFITADELAAAAGSVRGAELSPEAEGVLLTGASGFLGRFLLLELLERLPEGRGKVVCIVRAPSDSIARERLRAAYLSSDAALSDRLRRLSENGRLTVIAGDLMKPRFGLSDERYDRLSDEVDCVVHNGALVNHALSYAQLFEPNVLGTVEVMRLALRRRIKSLNFVSSVGVASGLGRREPVGESEDGRSLWKERPIDGGHAVGYGTSKWACEVLLRELHDRCGVPVNVFRCSMIMPHPEILGQANTADFLTRLLCGIVYTGLAPRSFYAGRPSREEGGSGGAHFDGLPVDFVARVLATIAVYRRPDGEPRPWPSYETYHVVNPHRSDGISLDVLVDWVQSAGYAVERVEDHARWYRLFQDRLNALREPQKQRSPLALLSQWERPIRAEDEPCFDAQRLQQRLRQLAKPGAPEPVDAPHLSEPFLHRTLQHLVYLGLIEGPGTFTRPGASQGGARS